MKISIDANIPDHLGHAFLQHLRDFDTAHPGCHLRIVANAPNASVEEMSKMLDLSPPFANTKVVKR